MLTYRALHGQCSAVLSGARRCSALLAVFGSVRCCWRSAVFGAAGGVRRCPALLAVSGAAGGVRRCAVPHVV